MRATLKQIAEYTNLSIPTVSEILNNKKRLYNSETRTRVIAAAQRLGYRPNESARSIKTGRFGALALLLSSDEARNSLSGPFLHSMGEEMGRRNLLLTLASISDRQLAEEGYVPQILRTLAVDGLLINYIAGFPERLVSLVRDHRIPSIWINSKPGSDCLYPDDLPAARAATRHLLELGHRRIAYVDYTFGFHNDDPVHYSCHDRLKGYVQAMRRAGLEPREIREDKSVPMEERQHASLRWLAPATRPTALLVYNTETVLPVMAAALSLGLKVPDDLSVITFHDGVNCFLGSRIDTMVLPQAEIGHLAVERVMEKVDDPLKVFPPQALPLTLKKGWTTAPPPASARRAR